MSERRQILKYPERLALAHTPTPLQPLNNFSQQYGLPPLWLKRDDLTGSVTGGNKVRKLEYVLADARAQSADVLITYGGVNSNHCRATALLGAQLGFDVHLMLRGEPQSLDGNLLLDTLAGARISYYSASEFKQRQQEIEEQWVDYYAGEGKRAYCIPIGASDACGVWGYVRAAEELAADFAGHGIAPQHIVCASGSGGTQAGLIVGAHAVALGASVWGINVCDDAAWFEAKISHDLAAWQARYAPDFDTQKLRINMLDGHVGAGYAKASDAVLQTIADLAQSEGIVLDPVYTGKALHGLISELRDGRLQSTSGDIVFIHTGGVFGMYPFRGQFEQLLRAS